jgi:hypothetical protein
VSCMWTSSNSSSIHIYTKMTKMGAFTSPHSLGEVREYFSTRLPGHWIGRGTRITVTSFSGS